LKFGGKLISEIQDFNHFMSYKACFNSNEENFERNTVTNGILMDYQMIDDEVGIHTGRSYKGDAVLFEEFNDLKQIPTYQIRLVDMFPWLGKVQLPLYLMKEQVSIELFFETDNAKKYITPKGGTDITSPIVIDTEQTKLVADYIYYPQPIMDNYEAQIAKTGLTIPILEYGLVKMTVALVSDDVKILRNIGGANRMVTKLIIMNSETGKTRQVLFNDFGSSLVSKDGATFRYNIKYNDRNLYPRNIDNVAHAFNQVQNAEGLPLFITGGEYDVDRADYTTKKIEGYDLNIAAQTNTRGFVAIKLDGERVNSAGIEVDMALFDTNGDVVTRIYLEMGCILTLKDGKVNKTYA
jgi:hypothetical protein